MPERLKSSRRVLPQEIPRMNLLMVVEEWVVTRSIETLPSSGMRTTWLYN